MDSLNILVDNLFINQADAPKNIPGYLIRSTARANVEDYKNITRDKSLPTINDLIQLLYKDSIKSKDHLRNVEIVIAIHGYNTGGADSDLSILPMNDKEVDGVWKDPYQKLCRHVNNDELIKQKSGSLVFLGYRWPSETIAAKNFTRSLSALPFLLKVLLLGSLIIGVVSLSLFFWLSSPLFILFIILAACGCASVVSLVILRAIVYFRDSYRATNYGVNDLVELIRQLNQGLMELASKDKQFNAEDYWQQYPIKLSFIAHSMGGHVITQAVRILSDVFDSDAVGEINNEKARKNPSSSISKVFSLGRLILVSPDIPVLTITSGRANFLRSSLRRFEEAYLFSNEGDLALRLASTAANYFSFPAKTKIQEHRLGNVTVRPKPKYIPRSKSKQIKEQLPNEFELKYSPSSKSRKAKKRSQSEYGIVNLDDKSLKEPLHKSLLKYLEVNILNQKQNQGLDLNSQQDPQEAGATTNEDSVLIANLFTYFDCTEYKDRTDYPNAPDEDHQVMILDKQTTPLTFLEYLQLGRAYLGYSAGKPFAKNARDVHGGYYRGKFSQQLMYRLAFVGFQEFLDFLLVTPPDKLVDELKINEPLPPELKNEIRRTKDLQTSNSLPETVSNTGSGDRQSRSPEPEKRQIALKYLSWIMEQKQIQTVLSPERYLVDVMGEEHKKVRQRLCGTSTYVLR